MHFATWDLAVEAAGKLVTHLNSHPNVSLAEAAKAVYMDFTAASITNNSYTVEYPGGRYVISRDPLTGEWSGKKQLIG